MFAFSHATFRLPEFLRRTEAIEGGLPRLELIVGMQMARLLGLTWYTLDAEEACKWGLVMRIGQSEGGSEKGRENLLMVAVEITRAFAAMSLDSVIVTKARLTVGWELQVSQKQLRWLRWLRWSLERSY